MKRSKCYIVVTDIAKDTFVGRMASRVTGPMGPGHFQRVMSSIGVTLLVLCVRPSTRFQEIMIRGCIRIRKHHSLVVGYLDRRLFRGVNIATPSENNLLVYILILLVRTTSLLLGDPLPLIAYRSLVSLSVCPALRLQRWPSVPRSLLGERPSYRS